VNGEALAELKSGLADTEIARATEVWRRKFGKPPADAIERSRQMRFLIGRGFSQRAVRAAMQGNVDDDEFYDE
jgi:regulatory protein